MSDLKAAGVFDRVRNCRNKHNCDMNCENCPCDYTTEELNQACMVAIEALVERGKE